MSTVTANVVHKRQSEVQQLEAGLGSIITMVENKTKTLISSITAQHQENAQFTDDVKQLFAHYQV